MGLFYVFSADWWKYVWFSAWVIMTQPAAFDPVLFSKNM